jgi:acyl dehydratase
MADATARDLLPLDDLHVGQRFTSGTHALDERQIMAFAGEFDPQPFHTDPAAAKGTLFGGLGDAVTLATGSRRGDHPERDAERQG